MWPNQQRRPAQNGKVAGATPATRTIFGMPTGQASRASVLTSACFRAGGASPPHSAISNQRARSSKRAVRLISGVALDQCLVPERYRTRVPLLSNHSFRSASIKVMQRPFKPQNRARYPGRPPIAESFNSKTPLPRLRDGSWWCESISGSHFLARW